MKKTFLAILMVIICCRLYSQQPTIFINEACGETYTGVVEITFNHSLDTFPLPYLGEYFNETSGDFEEIAIDSSIATFKNLFPGEYVFKIDLDSLTLMEFCAEVLDNSFIENTREPIINDPQSCTENNGLIRFLSGSFNNIVYPASYEWSNGDSSLTVTNLSAGDYDLTITDSRGCTFDSLYSLGSQLINTEVITAEPCEGLENGFISIISTSSIPNETFSYLWSTGETTNDIDDIGGGIYIVTVTGDSSQCERIDSINLEEIPSDGPLTASYTINAHTCKDQANGSITIEVLGGNEPYLVATTDQANNLIQIGTVISNVPKGSFTTTIIDDCNREVILNFDINDIHLSYHAEIGLLCGRNSQTDIQLNIISDNPITEYLWSNGATSKDLVNIGEGEYFLQMKDIQGCDFTTETFSLKETRVDFDYENSVYPCEGLSDGILKLNILNPNGLNYAILDTNNALIVQGNEIINSVDVPNLRKGYHPITFDASPECTFTERIYLPDQPTTKEFSRFDKETNTCFFNEVCQGELIGDETWQSQPFQTLSDNLLDACKVVHRCEIGGEVVKEERRAADILPILVYRDALALLNKEYPGAYDTELKWVNKKVSNTKDLGCWVVRVCPITFRRLSGAYPLGIHQLEYEYIEGTTCHRMSCVLPVFPWLVTKTYCLENWNDLNALINVDWTQYVPCQPKVFKLIELLFWHDQMQVDFDDYKAGAELFDYVDSKIQQYPDGDYPPEFTCGTIGFCLSDFKILSNNSGDFDCDQEKYFEYTYYSDLTNSFITQNLPPCQIITIDNINVFICPDKDGINYDVLYLNEYDPSTLAFGDTTVTTNYTSIDTTFFDKFAVKTYDNHISVVPVYTTNTDTIFYEKEIHKYTWPEYTKVVNIEEFFYDWGDDTLYTTKRINKDSINIILSPAYGEGTLLAMYSKDLKVYYIEEKNDTLIIEGRSGSVIKIDSFQQYLGPNHYKYTLKYSLINKTVGIDFVKDSKQIIRTEYFGPVYVTKENHYTDFEVITVADTIKYIDSIVIDTTFTIDEVITVKNSKYLSLKGYGTVVSQGDTILEARTGRDIVLQIDSFGIFQEVIFDKPSSDSTFLRFSPNHFYYTINSKKDIVFENKTFESIGDEGFIIFKYQNYNEDSIYYYHQNQHGEESLEDLLEVGGGIMLGGNLSSKYAGFLGNQFHMKSSTFNQAFTSSLIDSSFVKLNSLNNNQFLTTSTKEKTDKRKLILYPNPTSDKFNVRFDDSRIIKSISIYNTLGNLVYNQTDIQRKRVVINTKQYSAGVHYVNVTDEKGEVFSKRIVLMDE